MKLYQLVLKDVMRRKKRVLYATLGVIIGTMTIVGILTVAHAGQARIYEQLEKYGANLNVIPATKTLNTGLGDLTLGMVTVGDNYIDDDKLPLIQSIADAEIKKALNIQDEGKIATVAPKLYVTTEIQNVSVMAVGIEPLEERFIKTWWAVREGDFLQGGEQALVGSLAAELLQLKVGDSLPLNGSNVTITGILEQNGSNEDYQIFVPLPVLQTAFDKEGLISSVDIRALCNACPVEVIADAINQEVPGVRALAVKQVAATEMGMLERINKLLFALAAVTLLIGGFGVTNTLLTSIHERIRDIGIMRSVGASRNQIIKILIYEAVIIGIAGGILGYLGGTLLGYLAGPLIFEGITVKLVPWYFPLCLGISIVVSVLATLYPAFRATRIRVADSFRSL